MAEPQSQERRCPDYEGNSRCAFHSKTYVLDQASISLFCRANFKACETYKLNHILAQSSAKRKPEPAQALAIDSDIDWKHPADSFDHPKI